MNSVQYRRIPSDTTGEELENEYSRPQRAHHPNRQSFTSAISTSVITGLLIISTETKCLHQ